MGHRYALYGLLPTSFFPGIYRQGEHQRTEHQIGHPCSDLAPPGKSTLMGNRGTQDNTPVQGAGKRQLDGPKSKAREYSMATLRPLGGCNCLLLIGSKS